jgi:hypothetical protein
VIRSVKPYVSKNAIIMIYHSLFHAVMTYSVEIPPIVLRYLACKKGQLELLWGVVAENLVETCPKN